MDDLGTVVAVVLAIIGLLVVINSLALLGLIGKVYQLEALTTTAGGAH